MKNFKTKKTRIIEASFFLSALMALALATQPALAQTGAGVVTGTVRDANRAVVPGADVTITNNDT
ncbi:MAG TPA: hypothetical protein VGL91_17890, partial [Acidobacteriota bacterium]